MSASKPSARSVVSRWYIPSTDRKGTSQRESEVTIATRSGGGRGTGHDWEDWFRAESELLRPVSVSMSESDDRISIRANVLGFEGNELKVSVEPQRITILGKKEMSASESEEGKIEYIDRLPDQILHMIDLAADVIPEAAVVELQAGLLKFELPKATKQKAKKETAAA